MLGYLLIIENFFAVNQKSTKMKFKFQRKPKQLHIPAIDRYVGRQKRYKNLVFSEVIPYFN